MMQWVEDRWYLDGRPVHAGTVVEMCWPDGEWEAVRIESSEHGQTLWAHFEHHGEEMCLKAVRKEGTYRKFRWPEGRSA